jgi:hypothetical protein
MDIDAWAHTHAYRCPCLFPCLQDFFKVAVSFCGNHDNRGYNAGWGETYHGLSETQT